MSASHDCLIIARMEDAPVDLSLIPGVLWAIDTFGPGHPISVMVSSMLNHPLPIAVGLLLLPPGADLSAVLSEHHSRIKTMFPVGAIMSVLPFDQSDIYEVLDWLREEQDASSGLTLFVPEREDPA